MLCNNGRNFARNPPTHLEHFPEKQCNDIQINITNHSQHLQESMNSGKQKSTSLFFFSKNFNFRNSKKVDGFRDL